MVELTQSDRGIELWLNEDVELPQEEEQGEEGCAPEEEFADGAHLQGLVWLIEFIKSGHEDKAEQKGAENGQD